MDATSTQTPRALLLDGDPAALRLLALALQARGLEVRAALDAASGLELLLDELLALDVLVVDAALPGRDAASLVHLVRHAGGERDLKIVVLARGATGEARAQLLALGADTVLDPARGHEAAARAIAAVAAGPVTARPRRDAAGEALRGTLLAIAAPLRTGAAMAA